MEKHLDIPTADGAMNTFVVYPDGPGPHPVVLFMMDAPGKREELHDMARRLATVGYYVVLPNLYYRQSRDFYAAVKTKGKPATLSLMEGYNHFEVMESIGNPYSLFGRAALEIMKLRPA